MIEIEDNLINSFKKFLESEEGKKDLSDRQERKKEISRIFAKNNIKNMEIEQFESVIRKLYASEFWHKKDYLIEKIGENGIENIKNAFFNLLYSSEPLKNRYDDFRIRIKHIGPSMLTEIISFTNPNSYCIWNDKPKNVLPYLRYDKELPERVFKYQIDGENYTNCIKVMENVRNQLKPILNNPDFIDTDLFLYYIFSRIMPKEEKKEKKEKKQDPEKSEKDLRKDKEKFINTHSDAQGVLLEIGNMLEFDTYVAKEDRKKIFNRNSLGEIAILEDVPAFSFTNIVDIAKHIDVIWFSEEFPLYCFEVEESTSVTNGLNRLADLERFNVSMFIVGSKEKKDKYKKEINRYSFRNIKENTKFLDYDKLEEFYKITKKYTTLKKELLGD